MTTALSTEWAAITTAHLDYTTAQKLAALNAVMVTGPTVDVPVSAVVGLLAINEVLESLKSYAASPPGGATPSAVTAAKNLVDFLLAGENGSFQASNPTIAAALTTDLATLAVDASLHGITTTITGQLEAMWVGPQIPWWQANGFAGPISLGYLTAESPPLT